MIVSLKSPNLFKFAFSRATFASESTGVLFDARLAGLMRRGVSCGRPLDNSTKHMLPDELLPLQATCRGSKSQNKSKALKKTLL